VSSRLLGANLLTSSMFDKGFLTPTFSEDGGALISRRLRDGDDRRSALLVEQGLTRRTNDRVSVARRRLRLRT